jgi:hypothetical protein
MKEPFSIFQRRFENRAIPIPYIKLYLMMLLKSLDYLHTSCKIAHTGMPSILPVVWVGDAN